MKAIRDYLALALDNCNKQEQIKHLVNSTRQYIGIFKIGLEQFCRFGPSIVEMIKHEDCSVFLDLKFHDIPNTVAQAVKSVANLGVSYLTIHTQGGKKMMKAAVEAAAYASMQGLNPPRLIGVTLLTSHSPMSVQQELKVVLPLEDYVYHLRDMALECGLQGIVCAASDLQGKKFTVPQNFEIITPGIRPDGFSAHDQKRTATPAQAIEAGATILVIGRAITESGSPSEAAQKIFEEVRSAVGV